MWRKINKGRNLGLQKKRYDLVKCLVELERKCSGEECQKCLRVLLKCIVDKFVDVERYELMVFFIVNEFDVVFIENKVMLMECFCFISEKMSVNLRNLLMEICKEYYLESKYLF